MHNIKRSRKRKNESNKVERQAEKGRKRRNGQAWQEKGVTKKAFLYSMCVSVFVCMCEYTLHKYIHHTQCRVCFSTSGFRVALCLC